MRTLRAAVVVAVLAVSVALTVACTSNDAGPTPSDPVLAQGQQIYKDRCVTCHGAKGQGGRGLKLAGKVATVYPNIADEIAVIESGRGSMPAWKNALTPDEIEAVARYTRECLGTTC